MKIKLTKSIEEEREISIPAFFKSDTRYFAVLDEETQVTLTLLPSIGYTNIRHGSLEQRDISEAYKEMDLCTEEDFLEVYNKAHDSVRLRPLITLPVLEEHLNYQKENNY